MTHLGEGTLQELLDGELSPDQQAAAHEHLATCGACAAELADLRALDARATALFGETDEQPPLLRAQAEFARRRRGMGPLAHARRALPRAAAVVLVLAGAAAAAVPGSPVRAWVAELAPRERAPEPPRVVEAPVAPAPAPVAEEAPSGVSILPKDGQIRVIVSGASPDLRVRTRLSDGPQAEVRATGAAAGTARFRTSPGRIEVLGAGPGEVLVTLPAAAHDAYVEVNGRVYAARQGGGLRSLEPRVGGSRAEPVFRAGP